MVTPEGENTSVKGENKLIFLNNEFHLDLATASKIPVFQRTRSMNALSEDIDIVTAGIANRASSMCPLYGTQVSGNQPGKAALCMSMHTPAFLLLCRWLMMPDGKGKEWTQMYTQKL